MKTPSMLSTFILIVASVSCSKQDTTNTQVIPTPQYIKLSISYSGTANNWDTHDLYFIVNYSSPLPSYNPFHYAMTNGVIGGWFPYTSPYKFEPGDYEISGFYDFNNSGTWEDYEPVVVPKNITVNGISQQQFDFILQDKTTPDQQGWIQGSISYSGNATGTHDVYAEIHLGNQFIGKFKLTSTPVNLLQGSIGYSTDYLSHATTYWIDYFWDVNDNGTRSLNDPQRNLSPIVVCPGLPTVKNIQLQ